jgi:C_GCAxxG_C_C family probable redox protein
MSIAIGGETPAPEAARARRARIEEAGRKALEFKAQGFHCSESVFLAINDALKITDPRMVRAITGFHGGGGTHRLKPNVDLTPLLADIAAGTHKSEPDEIPVVQVQHLCGGLAAGIMCMGLLFGRSAPEDDLTCVDELCYELHRRFQEELGHNECRFLREIWVPRSEDESCAPIYRRATEIAVDIILSAQDLVPECPGPMEDLARWEFAPRET